MESEPLTLQLFIGTADDRLLRPHAFYQVHRITGKTVSTPSHEAMHNNTKVLEIPLLPENNMRAMWVPFTDSSVPKILRLLAGFLKFWRTLPILPAPQSFFLCFGYEWLGKQVKQISHPVGHLN